MNVHDTGRLVVWFKDVPPETHLPPGTAVPSKPAVQAPAQTVPGGSKSEPLVPGTPRPLPGGPEKPAQLTSGKPAGPTLAAPDNRPPPRPFDLTARSVECWVLRSPIKSTMDQLWCEGSVHVKQDPAGAEREQTAG
jgi:hypothetical protein